MSIRNKIQLESNSKIKVNFDGGDLSSDFGLLLIKEFIHKQGFMNNSGLGICLAMEEWDYEGRLVKERLSPTGGDIKNLNREIE